MILLVAPEMFSLTSTPPVGLGYIAGALHAAGADVKLLDLNFHRDKQELSQTLNDPNLRWVGINSTVQNIPGTREAVRAVRDLREDIPLVLGGSWPTLYPERALDEMQADIAVAGEAEDAVVEIDRALRENADLSTVQGIAYRPDPAANAAFTGSRQPPDINTIAPPMWDLIPPRRYSAIPWQAIRKGRIVSTILTGRGCPYRCTYCAASVVTGRRWRPRKPDAVIQELKMMVQKHNVDEVHILDDNFIGDRAHVMDFCNGIIDSGIRIHWKTPNGVRADAIDRELLAAMKASGCYMLGFGIESGAQEVLRKAKKPLDLDAAADAVRMARDAGILTFGYFILGLPGDNEKTIEQTIRWAKDVPLDLANFSYCIPYPGSELFDGLDEATKEQVISRSYHFAPVQLCDVPLPRLKQLFRRAYARFYLRPGPLATILRFARPVTAYALLRISWYYFGRKVRLPRA